MTIDIGSLSWRTMLCSRQIPRDAMAGVPCVVVGATVAFHESDEARVRDALSRVGITFLREASLTFEGQSAEARVERQATSRPMPIGMIAESEPRPPSSMEDDLVQEAASIVSRVLDGRDAAEDIEGLVAEDILADEFVDVLEMGSERRTRVQTAGSPAMRVPSVMAPVVEAIEEQIQRTAAIARSVRTSVVTELCGLVKTNSASLVTTVRDGILSKRIEKSQAEMRLVTAIAENYVKNELTRVREELLSSVAMKALAPVMGPLEAAGLIPKDSLTEETLRKIVPRSRSILPESDSVHATLMMLVSKKLEEEAAFAELSSLKNVSETLKKKMTEEVDRISEFPFVEEFWCDRSSFNVKVKGANIFDTEMKKKVFLGRYVIRISLDNHSRSGLFTFSHVSTPNADWVHPHISGRGSTVCFGSQNVVEGLLKMLSNLDLSLVVSVLYSFLNMYNASSPYKRPGELLVHWESVGWNDNEEKKANGIPAPK